MSVNIRTMPGHKVRGTISGEALVSEKGTGERMRNHYIISLQKGNISSDEVFEQKRPPSQILQSHMIQDRESVPQHLVCDAVDFN